MLYTFGFNHLILMNKRFLVITQGLELSCSITSLSGASRKGSSVTKFLPSHRRSFQSIVGLALRFCVVSKCISHKHFATRNSSVFEVSEHENITVNLQNTYGPGHSKTPSCVGRKVHNLRYFIIKKG